MNRPDNSNMTNHNGNRSCDSSQRREEINNIVVMLSVNMLNKHMIKNYINWIAIIFFFAVFHSVWTNEVIMWFVFHVKSFSHEISEFYWKTKYFQDNLLSNPVSLDWRCIDVDWIDVIPVDLPSICFEKFNCIGIRNEILRSSLRLYLKYSICFILFMMKQSTCQDRNKSHFITELHMEFLIICLGTIKYYFHVLSCIACQKWNNSTILGHVVVNIGWI